MARNRRPAAATVVAGLLTRGATFRNEPPEGPGGTQVLIEDPSGNPLEVIQAAS